MRANQPNFPMAIPGQKFRVLVHMSDDSNAAVNVESSTLELEGNVIRRRQCGREDSRGRLECRRGSEYAVYRSNS